MGESRSQKNNNWEQIHKVLDYSDNLPFFLSYPKVILPTLVSEFAAYGDLSNYHFN